MVDRLAMLKKERDELLSRYLEARDDEKPGILVRIMDIDEQIAAAKPLPAKIQRQQAG